MDTLRNVGDSLPKPAAHTSGIPSGLFVFGGAAGSVQQSNADDSRALDELSSMGTEFDGTVRAQPRQARRMSASKASSRRRRSSSSSSSGTQPRLPTPALFVPGDGGGNVNSGGGGGGNAGERTNPVLGHNQSRGMEAEGLGFGGGSSSSGSGSGTHGNPSAAAAVAVAAEEGKSCGDDGGGEGVQERGGGEGGTGVKPSKGRSSWSGMDRKAALRQQQKRLLLLRHASRCACSEKGSVCQVSPDCDEVKALWKHIAHCQDKACTRPHCESSRFVLKHYSRCRHRECPLCGPVRAVIAKARRQRREESNGGEAQEGEGHEDSDEDMEDFEDHDGDGDNVDDDDDDL